MLEESKNGGLMRQSDSMFDPKYTQFKKIEKLETLFNIDNQVFILNLC